MGFEPRRQNWGTAEACRRCCGGPGGSGGCQLSRKYQSAAVFRGHKRSEEVDVVAGAEGVGLAVDAVAEVDGVGRDDGVTAQLVCVAGAISGRWSSTSSGSRRWGSQ